MAYTTADKRTLPNYQMGIMENDKLGLGFHEKQGVFAHVSTIVLRTLESPVAIVRILGCKDYANAHFYRWTDSARAGLDKHVARKRAAASTAHMRNI